MAGSHWTNTPFITFTMLAQLVPVGDRDGRDVVKQDDEQEEEHAQEVGEHSELRVRDHLDVIARKCCFVAHSPWSKAACTACCAEPD